MIGYVQRVTQEALLDELSVESGDDVCLYWMYLRGKVGETAPDDRHSASLKESVRSEPLVQGGASALDGRHLKRALGIIFVSSRTMLLTSLISFCGTYFVIA
jgi:hypothetical protein